MSDHNAHLKIEMLCEVLRKVGRAFRSAVAMDPTALAVSDAAMELVQTTAEDSLPEVSEELAQYAASSLAGRRLEPRDAGRLVVM